MAGKTNAKPAQQANPAKDAAVAETVGGSAPVRELFQGFANMLMEADVRVRKNGEEVSPLPEDLLAVTLRQDEAVFVTCDGRKFKLKGEKINEA